MHTSFHTLVGARDAMAAGAALESIEQAELGRELRDLTPRIDTPLAAPLSHQASELAMTGPVCIGAATTLTTTATTAAIDQGGATAMPDLSDL